MIEIPGAVWEETIDVLRSCGKGRRECVTYWVGPADHPAQITRVVHPEHSATAGHYRIHDAWVTRFWLELAASDERVMAQVHTHGGRAGHSPTDDEGALVYQAGFLSLVLAGFAMRDNVQLGAFLAELDEMGMWHEVPVNERLQWP